MRSALVVTSLLLLGSCAREAPDAMDVGRACELLRSEAEVSLTLPGVGSSRGTLADALAGGRPGPEFDVAIYLVPTLSDELTALERQVRHLPGISVVAVMDQAATYAEFATLFAENEEMVDGITPDVLPASVRVTVTSDDAVDRLREALDGDERIYEIVDYHESRVEGMRRSVRQFRSEVRELEQVALGDLRRAVALLRSTDEPGRSELRDARAVIRDFFAKECGKIT